MKKSNSIKIKICLWVLAMVNFPVFAQTAEDFQREQFISQGDTLKYRILYPKGFSEAKEYPVMLFLHGAGERGNDNESQLLNGGQLFLEKSEEFPAIVIFPQAPKEDYWAKISVDRDTLPLEFKFQNKQEPTKSLDLVMKLMDSITAEKFVKKDQIYVGGLSMGGMGTFELLYRKPEMFAAAIAICGAADPSISENYRKGLPIWIFHGELDDVVQPKYSKAMAREINTNGGNAKLSLYPEANHNSWDTAFAEPYLLPWLFSQKKDVK